MPRSKATIVDIANELGISKSAVANVLSGTGRYSAETSALVRETAERLGYVSNRAARGLRTGRMGAYGLHVPALARDLPFYMEFAFGAARGADAARADLTLFTSELDPARAFQVDGAIAIDAVPDEPVVAALLRARVPTVAVGRYHGRDERRIAATLDARHAELQRQAFDHLYARGRRRPVLLAVEHALSSSWAVGTHETYTLWCSEHGVEPRFVEVSAEVAPGTMGELLTDAVEVHRADAIVCAAQGQAAQLRLLMQERGIRPDDLGLVSLAASALELADPAITAIDLDPAGYGAAAATLLTEVLERGPGETLDRVFDGGRVRLAG